MTADQGAATRPTRLLIFVVAYKAEKTMRERPRPHARRVCASRDVEVLVIDDSSPDSHLPHRPQPRGRHAATSRSPSSTTRVNQGYGGNQKLGFRYAIEQASTSSRCCTATASTRRRCCRRCSSRSMRGEADVVLGSRMLERAGCAQRRNAALQVRRQPGPDRGSRTGCSARQLCEFHSGYRVYSVAALASDPVRAQRERLPLRYRDHHSVPSRPALASRRCRSPPITATRSAA